MKDGEWKRYRKEVKNNGSFHCLHIRNIRSGDHASYVCEAISPLGGSSTVVHNLLVVDRHMDSQQHGMFIVSSRVSSPQAKPKIFIFLPKNLWGEICLTKENISPPPTVDILENPDFFPKFWGEMTL